MQTSKCGPQDFLYYPVTVARPYQGIGKKSSLEEIVEANDTGVAVFLCCQTMWDTLSLIGDWLCRVKSCDPGMLLNQGTNMPCWSIRLDRCVAIRLSLSSHTSPCSSLSCMSTTLIHGSSSSVILLLHLKVVANLPWARINFLLEPLQDPYSFKF
jgi:hypothetical protein